MNRNGKNNGKAANRLLRRLAADKKKSIIAMALLGVMAVMWLRVLSGKRPVAAPAATTQTSDAANTKQPAVRKVTFVELPIIPGRNDVIVRDFFNARGWKDFGRHKDDGPDASEQGTLISPKNQDELLEQLTSKLRLEALVGGDQPRAFINNRLVSKGDSVVVKRGNDTYLFEVVGIFENSVLLKHNEAHVTLKLTQESEVHN